MSEEKTDIEVVQNIFGVDAIKAQNLIDKGVNVQYLRNGPINGAISEKLSDAEDQMKTDAESIIDEFKSELTDF